MTAPIDPSTVSEAPELDPLFGSGLKLAYQKPDQETARSTRLLPMLRRLPGLIALTSRLGWQVNRGAMLIATVGQLVIGLATAASYLLTRSVLTGLLSVGGARGGIAAFLPAVVALVVVTTVRGGATILSSWAAGRLGPRISRSAQLLLLERSIGVELATVEQADFHNLLGSARRGADEAQRMTDRAFALFTGIISMLSMASVLIMLNPLLLGLLLLTLLPRAWGVTRSAGVRHASARRWMDLTRQLDLLTTLMIHRDGAEEIRVHRVAGFLLRNYRRLVGHSLAEQDRLARYDAATRVIAGLSSGLASVLAYGFLLMLLLAGQMTLPVVATAVLALRASTMSLASLMTQVQQLCEDGLYILDWQEACRQCERETMASGERPVATNPTLISTHDLRFRYPGAKRPALDGVDVRIGGGEVVAFVGENGSGKSTLVKLLTGLYLPTEGQVSWDGVPIAELDRAAVFDRVSLMSQDFQQWPFTALANVTIGRDGEHPDLDRVRASARTAGADRVVDRLDAGWDTLLAREFFGGTALSGGQWQRIGLARCWYRDAPVLIFDEPTSSLDPNHEIEIFDQIIELAGRGRTVVLITHRLASVARADRIYVLDKGKVVEEGTHDGLLSEDGWYAEMYRSQAAQFRSEDTGGAEFSLAKMPTSSGQR